MGSANVQRSSNVMTAEEGLAQPLGVLLVPDFVVRPGRGPRGGRDARAKARASAAFVRAQPNNEGLADAPTPLARFDRTALERLYRKAGRRVFDPTVALRPGSGFDPRETALFTARFEFAGERARRVQAHVEGRLGGRAAAIKKNAQKFKTAKAKLECPRADGATEGGNDAKARDPVTQAMKTPWRDILTTLREAYGDVPYGQSCTFCGMVGAHWPFECDKQRPPPDVYRCRHCRLMGHWDYNCPRWRRALIERRVARLKRQDAYEKSLTLKEYNKTSRPCLTPFGPGQLLPFGAWATLPPPDGYVCKRCGVPGHWLEKCTNPPALLDADTLTARADDAHRRAPGVTKPRRSGPRAQVGPVENARCVTATGYVVGTAANTPLSADSPYAKFGGWGKTSVQVAEAVQRALEEQRACAVRFPWGTALPVEIPQNTFFQIERAAVHSYGPDPHSCAVLCNVMAGWRAKKWRPARSRCARATGAAC